MSKLGIYIVEDEPLYAGKMEMLVDQLGYELVGMSDNSDTAFIQITENKPDLLLVDINIHGTMDGISLVTKLQESMTTPTIFVTSLKDEETFERALTIKPHAYVTKPFEADDLQRAIELAITKLTSTVQSDQRNWENDRVYHDTFFIKNGHKLEKVRTEDILYLEVEDKYSMVYTIDRHKYVLRMSMGQVQEKLPASDFIRTHRKYTINLNHITSIDLQQYVVLIGEMEIPISRNHKEELLKRLEWLQ